MRLFLALWSTCLVPIFVIGGKPKKQPAVSEKQQVEQGVKKSSSKSTTSESKKESTSEKECACEENRIKMQENDKKETEMKAEIKRLNQELENTKNELGKAKKSVEEAEKALTNTEEEMGKNQNQADGILKKAVEQAKQEAMTEGAKTCGATLERAEKESKKNFEQTQKETQQNFERKLKEIDAQTLAQMKKMQKNVFVEAFIDQEVLTQFEGLAVKYYGDIKGAIPLELLQEMEKVYDFLLNGQNWSPKIEKVRTSVINSWAVICFEVSSLYKTHLSEHVDTLNKEGTKLYHDHLSQHVSPVWNGVQEQIKEHNVHAHVSIAYTTIKGTIFDLNDFVAEQVPTAWAIVSSHIPGINFIWNFLTRPISFELLGENFTFKKGVYEILCLVILTVVIAYYFVYLFLIKMVLYRILLKFLGGQVVQGLFFRCFHMIWKVITGVISIVWDCFKFLLKLLLCCGCCGLCFRRNKGKQNPLKVLPKPMDKKKQPTTVPVRGGGANGTGNGTTNGVHHKKKK